MSRHSIAVSKKRAFKISKTLHQLADKGKRWVASLAAFALVAAMVVVGAQAAQAASTAPIKVTKTGPSYATPGATLTYFVTLQNTNESGGQSLYNVTLADLLPSGISYVSGTTAEQSPYDFGEPKTSAVTSGNIATGQTSLQWGNVLDLAAGQKVVFKYSVKVGDTYQVGDSFENKLTAYANTDPMTVPQLDANGTASSNTFTPDATGSGSQTTTISSVVITKDKDDNGQMLSGGGDARWLRGAHDNERTITLKVQNQGLAQTTTVVDYLPASLEFLGSASDNSTLNKPEWTNGTDGTSSSPDLTGSNGGDGTLQSVTTVTDPAGYPAGTYTKVVWSLPLAANQSSTITYKAAIPLCANTMKWPNGAPSGSSLEQATNLDNNICPDASGAPEDAGYTRDLVNTSVVNYAEVQNTAGSKLSADTQTYIIRDLVANKSPVVVDGKPESHPLLPVGLEYEMHPGTVVDFTLSGKTSEYVSMSDVVFTDKLSDGLLPVLPNNDPNSAQYKLVYNAVLASYGGTAPSAGDPGYDDFVAWKALTPKAPTNGQYESVTYNGDGTFSITLTSTSISRSQQADVTLPVYQRTVYTSHLNKSVLTGDVFTNKVDVSGNSHAAVDQEVADSQTANCASPVNGGSSGCALDDTYTVQLRAAYPSVKKQVLPSEDSRAFTNTFKSGGTAASSDWQNSLGSGDTTFNAGDIVWFHLKFTIDDPNVQIQNLVLRDYLPAGTQLYGWQWASDNEVGGSDWNASYNGAAVAPGQVQSGLATGGQMAWSPSASVTSYPTGADRTLSINLGVIVSSSASIGGTSAAAWTNLLKGVTSSSAGELTSYRDSSTFNVNPSPQVTLAKTVYKVNGATPGATVKGGDTVAFKVQVNNGSKLDVTNANIWDVLPGDLTNAKVYSDDALSDEIATTSTANTNDTTTYKWNENGTIAAGGSEDYYVVATVPNNVLVNTTYTNHAGIRDYRTPLNWDGPNDGSQTWYPQYNIDATAPTANTVRADDTASVHTPSVTLTKQISSGLAENGNNGSSQGDTSTWGSSAQAVPGEKVNYKVVVTVPAHTSIASATLKDAISNTADPTVTLVGDPSVIATGGASASDVSPVSSTGTGYNFSFNANNGGKLTNNTDTDWVYEFDSTGYVSSDVPTGTPGTSTAKSVANTVTFNSQSQSGTKASATANIVQPTPKLDKKVSANGTNFSDSLSGATSSQQFTYRLDASVTGPDLKAPVFTDELPEGVTYNAVTDVKLAGTSLDSSEYTLTFDVASNTLTVSLPGKTLSAGKNIQVFYKATLPENPAALKTFTNTASVTGTSLFDSQVAGQNGAGVNKTYEAKDTADVKMQGPSIVKSVSPTSAVIGQSATWTIVAKLPANLSFPDGTITDKLPAGFTADGTPSVAVDGGTIPSIGSVSIDDQKLLSLPLGDVAETSTDRIVTITVPGYVNKSGNTATTATISNTANIGWNTTKGDNTTAKSESGSVSLGVNHPRVKITKAVSDATPQPGETFTYTVTVNNPSSVTAYKVKVSDTPNSNVVIQSQLSGSTVTDNAGTVTLDSESSGTAPKWVVSQIPAGGTATISYTAKLAASDKLTGSPLSNTATISSWDSLDNDNKFTYNNDNLPTGTTAADLTAGTKVTPLFPKVTVKKALADGQSTTVLKGDKVAYVLTYTNDASAGTAYNIKPSDQLPSGWTFDATSAVTVNGTAVAASSFTGPSTGADGTVTWAGADASTFKLEPGQELVISYTAKPGSKVATGMSIDHTNTASGTAADATGVTGHDSGNSQSYFDGSDTATVHIGQADLGITKSAAGSWVAGKQGSVTSSGVTGPVWKIVVHNYGPDTAQGPFTIRDTPTSHAGVTVGDLVDASGNSITKNSDGSYTTAEETLASGSELTFYLPVTLASTVTGTVENTAKVSGKTDEGGETHSDTDDATVDVTQQADLGITKTGPSEVTAGGDVTWTVTVTNDGPSTSYASGEKPITVTDALPSQVDASTATFGDFTGGLSAADVSRDGSHVTAQSKSDLGSGDSFSFTITAKVKSTVTEGFSNNANVTPGATTDPNSSNNSSTWTGDVNSGTTITATKTLDPKEPNEVTPGSTADYILTVTNTGTADARNVKITDPLPDGLTFKSFSNYTSDDGTWSSTATDGDTNVVLNLSDSLAPGATTKVKITVHVGDPITDGTPVTNTAKVTSDNAPEVDPRWDTNTKSSADLSIAKNYKSASPEIKGGPVAGGTVTYRVTVKNNGPSTSPATSANPISVTDALPAGFTYKSTDGGDDFSYTGTDSDGNPTFTRSSSLAPGAHATFTVTAEIPSGFLNGSASQQVKNTVVVSGPNDSNAANNSADRTVTIRDISKVSITKSFDAADSDVDGDGNLIAGGKATYTLKVTNEGPSDARSVSVEDAVPTGFTISSIKGPDGWTAAGSNTLTKDGLLKAGTADEITVVGTVDSAYAAGLGTGESKNLTNTATVTWTDGSSDDPQTDSSGATVPVVAQADLALTKTAIDTKGDATDSAPAGKQLSYQLKVTNNGLSQNDGPQTITDNLPDGVTFVSAVGDGWTGGPSESDPSKLVFTRDDPLASGADAATLTITVAVSSDLVSDDGDPVTVKNTATVDPGTTADPKESNNSDSASVDVESSADLAVTKTHSGTGKIGEQIPFTIAVKNLGVSTATKVKVVETLPQGLKYESIDGSDSAWSAGTATTNDDGTTTVTLTLDGKLAAGAEAPTLIVNATPEVAAYPAVTNTVDVTSAMTDPDESNNKATDELKINPEPKWEISKAAQGAFQIGKTGTYVITVKNLGLTEEPGTTTVTDPLPDGLTYVSASGDGAECSEDDGTVTCVMAGSFAVDETRTVTLKVKIGEKAYPSATNVASVTSDNADSSETASATTTVKQAAHAGGSDLATTGLGLGALLAALGAMLAGGLLLALRRRRRKRG